MKYRSIPEDVEIQLAQHPCRRIRHQALILILALLALLAAAPKSLAQSYATKYYTIGGGGGTSTGSVYTVTGTAGQHDAVGHQSGEGFSLMSGFWSVAAALSSDKGPKLRIVPKGRSVMIAWPDPSTGFQLQQSSSLAAPAWSDIRTAPVVVGKEKQVTVLLQPGHQFFRLHKPETR